MPKLTNPFPRTCIKCEGSEIDKVFPDKGNQCKECLKEYNTLYVRNKRGSKPRSRMTTEQRRQAQKESKQRQKANKAKKADEVDYEQQLQQEIKRLIIEASDCLMD